jgi:hypothetical protein
LLASLCRQHQKKDQICQIFSAICAGGTNQISVFITRHNVLHT